MRVYGERHQNKGSNTDSEFTEMIIFYQACNHTEKHLELGFICFYLEIASKFHMH